MSTEKILIEGKDNYGRLKQSYADKLPEMTGKEFLDFVSEAIYWSAWANNNPRSDYHWHADVCYRECQRRNEPEVYQEAYEKALARAV